MQGSDASFNMPQEPMQDPNMGAMPEDNPMSEEPMEEPQEQDPKMQEIGEIGEGLSDKDKHTLLKYARSLKDNAAEGGEEQEAPQQPMQESIILKKRQINSMHK